LKGSFYKYDEKGGLMIFHYYKSACNAFKKESLNFQVAVVSLAIGLAVFSLLISFVWYHYDYDRSITPNHEWYRLRVSYSDQKTPNKDIAGFPYLIMKRLRTEVPEIVDYTVKADYNILAKFTSEKGTVIPIINSSSMVTPNFPKVYNMKFIYGDKDSALTSFSDLIVSRSFALKYFGKENAIGEKVFLKTRQIHTVTGVFEDLPNNLHYRKEAYRFNSDVVNNTEEDIYSTSDVMIRISNPDNLPQVEKKINQFLTQFEQSSQVKRTCHIDPVHKIHYIQGLYEDSKTMNINLIHGTLILACLVLLSAFLNFYNLLNLIWEKRQNEFAYRKTLGAERKDIVLQIMTEYSVSFIFAASLAVVLYIGAQKLFSQWTELNLQNYEIFHHFGATVLMSILLVIFWLIGFISAYKIANNNEVQEDKRIRKKSRVFQYILFAQIFISVLFALSAMMTYLQIDYIRHYDLGYDKQNLIQYNAFSANIPGYIPPDILRQELENIPEIKSVTMTGFDIANKSEKKSYMTATFVSDHNGKEIFGKAVLYPADKGFFKKMNIRILKGSVSDMLPFNQNDLSGDMILNKTAADLFYPDTNPIGKSLKIPDDIAYAINGSSDMPSNTHIIKAVVDNVHFNSLYEKVEPVIFVEAKDIFEHVQIRYQPGKRDVVIQKANTVFEKLTQESIFSYEYEDIEQKIKDFYKEDVMLLNLIIFFALICTLIAIFGIISISSLHIFSQMKEIAIHKINGAEHSDLLKLYSKPFVVLTIIAWLTSVAFTWYLIDIFTGKFAIQAPHLWLCGLISFILTMLMVLLPVMYHIRKAYKTQASVYLNNE